VHFRSGPSKLAVENLRTRLAKQDDSDTPVGYQDVFRWNAEFFYHITRKYLILLGGAEKHDGAIVPSL